MSVEKLTEALSDLRFARDSMGRSHEEFEVEMARERQMDALCRAVEAIAEHMIETSSLRRAVCKWCDEPILQMNRRDLVAIGIEPEVAEVATDDGDMKVWALEDGSTVCTYYQLGYHDEDNGGPHQPK